MPDSKELSQEKQDLINKYQEKQARQRQDKQVTFGEQPVEPKPGFLNNLKKWIRRRKFEGYVPNFAITDRETRDGFEVRDTDSTSFLRLASGLTDEAGTHYVDYARSPKQGGTQYKLWGRIADIMTKAAAGEDVDYFIEQIRSNYLTRQKDKPDAGTTKTNAQRVLKSYPQLKARMINGLITSGSFDILPNTKSSPWQGVDFVSPEDMKSTQVTFDSLDELVDIINNISPEKVPSIGNFKLTTKRADDGIGDGKALEKLLNVSEPEPAKKQQIKFGEQPVKPKTGFNLKKLLKRRSEGYVPNFFLPFQQEESDAKKLGASSSVRAHYGEGTIDGKPLL